MEDKDRFFHLVTFEMNKEMFAIPIMNIQEIIRWTQVVSIPQAPDFVEGVINLRSKVIPVVSLKRRFGVADDKVEDAHCGSNARILRRPLRSPSVATAVA